MSTEMKPNFYEILNATNTATADELKSNYKQLILQCHPDKLQQQQQLKIYNRHKLVTNKNEANNSEFVAITEAWNCLKDPVKRKQYDAEQLLNKFHTHNNIYAHIKLSEMKKQLNTGEYFKGNDEVDTDHDQKVKESEENETKYIFTYDCRCGGQYIVDESAEQYYGKNNNSNHDHQHHYHETQIKSNDNNGVDVVDDDDDDDDADSTQNNKNSPNKVANNGGGCSTAAAAGSEGVVFIQPKHDDIEEEEEGSELIVECSECSLVIILNG